jgi:hypothetical protein
MANRPMKYRLWVVPSQGIRIDGGSATADLASFQTELGYAVAFADKIPFSL